MEKLVVGILAHVDAGKTTLSEGILYLTGKIRKLGRVDHKDAYLDTYNLEMCIRDRARMVMFWFRCGRIWTGLNGILELCRKDIRINLK